MRLSLKTKNTHAFSLGKANNLQKLVTREIEHSYCAGVATFLQIMQLLDGFQSYRSSSRWLALENVRLQKIVSMAWLD